MQKLGVVVVGIGRAGRARVRDIKKFAGNDDLIDVHLVGYVSRSNQEVEDLQKLTLDTALSNPEVNVIIVSTENESHESICRRAIDAGKHVLCEFPLARTSTAARGLLDLANEKGVVCYEEDIALLTDHYNVLRKLVQEKGFPTKSLQSLKARPVQWQTDFARGGSPFVSTINQLHVLVSIETALSAESAHIKSDPDGQGSETHGHLRDPSGGVHEVEIVTSANLESIRTSSFSYTFKDGTLLSSDNLQSFTGNKEPAKYGLFLRDFIQFVGAVRGTWNSEEWTRKTIRSLELADELYALANA